ncbi:AI-2E family transporter [Chryseolinea sp. T2]|uniref:AI-2E family transporter n=1 Tax=Chryseolinea sp. T2 TaxID=3129255 RepID=UPI0030787E6D
MDFPQVKLPTYLKLAQIIVGLIGFFYILYIGQDIFIPLTFAVIIGILLNPIVNFLVRKGLNRVLAISMAILGVSVVAVGIGLFIGSQLAHFSDTFPQFKEKFGILQKDAIDWTAQTFNISKVRINAWIAETKGGLVNSSVIKKTLGALTSLLVLVILPVYIFLVLYYKNRLLEFIERLFEKNEHNVVAEVLTETKALIQGYLVGLSLEAVVVAVLNSVALLIIGVEYAVLLGIIGALLNLIPYLGGLIAIALPMLVAMATGSPLDVLWVVIAYVVVQFLDNNFLVPRIVASKVRLNALISIIIVLIGNALWGISGMFLSIPLTAILKVIFDRIDSLKPFGFLLGDEESKKRPFAIRKT